MTNENPDKKEKPMTALHTIATVLIAGGTNVKAVSERLGHSKAGITLDAFTHVSQGMRADVSEDVERLLGGKKGLGSV